MLNVLCISINHCLSVYARSLVRRLVSLSISQIVSWVRCWNNLASAEEVAKIIAIDRRRKKERTQEGAHTHFLWSSISFSIPLFAKEFPLPLHRPCLPLSLAHTALQHQPITITSSLFLSTPSAACSVNVCSSMKSAYEDKTGHKKEYSRKKKKCIKSFSPWISCPSGVVAVSSSFTSQSGRDQSRLFI